MSEDGFCAVYDVDSFGMLLVLVFAFEIVIEHGDFILGSFAEIGFLFFLDLFIEEQLVVEVEITLWDDLEEGFAVKVDLVVLFKGLIVDVGVSESASEANYPFEMMRPFASLPGTVLTPWRRMISPHFIFS